MKDTACLDRNDESPGRCGRMPLGAVEVQVLTDLPGFDDSGEDIHKQADIDETSIETNKGRSIFMNPRITFMAIVTVLAFAVGCDDAQKPVINMVADVVNGAPEPIPITSMYTYIGFKPSNNTLTPINPADEWDGHVDTIWEKSRGGFYYSKHLLLDEWELRADPVSNLHDPVFEHWIYAVSSSKIIYDLSGGDYSKFEGYVGLMDDYEHCGHGGTVEFIFGIDDIGVWKSGKLVGIRDTEPVHVAFSIPADAQTLTIVVTDGGDGICSDHWTMGNARLTIGQADNITGSTRVPESTTLIGFKPANNTITPINPADEWDGWHDHIRERTIDGFYYTKHLLLDDWELEVAAAPNRHDEEFEYWISAVSSSKIIYDLSGGDYSRFSADLGLTWDYDACGHGGTVEFIFGIDNIGVWESDKIVGIRDTEPIHVAFDIPADAQTLTIIVTDGGDSINCDQWTMGNARLTHR